MEKTNKQLLDIVIKEISDNEKKSAICSNVLKSLPEWFGIDESTKAYVEGVKKHHFFVAEISNKPIGFYSIMKHFPLTWEIYVCGVFPKYHHLGIGSKLQQYTENFLKDKNVKFLTVKTLSESSSDKNYAKTREFYKAQGFIFLEEFKTLWDEYNPCLFMCKIL